LEIAFSSSFEHAGIIYIGHQEHGFPFSEKGLKIDGFRRFSVYFEGERKASNIR
jgi:hypothetical protein